MSLQFGNRKRYLFQEQTSEGTDAVHNALDAGNALVYQDVADMTLQNQALDDAPTRESWSASGTKKTFVEHLQECEFELPLTAGDGSTAQPFYHMLLKAMNLSEDTSSANQAIYSPSTEPVSWATVYQYIRNVENSKSRLRYMTDLRATAEFNISVGEEATISGSGMGWYNSISVERDYIDSNGDVVLLKDGTSPATTPSFSMADKSPLIPKAMTVTISGGQITGTPTFEISDFTLDLNWTQDAIDALTNAEGEMPHFNTRGDTEHATGGFTLLKASPQDFTDLISSYEAANELTLDVELVDIENTSRTVKFDIPNAQLGVEDEGDNGNLMSHEFQFTCNRDLASSLAGDNDFQITYNTP